MGVFNTLFGKPKRVSSTATWQEVGAYQAMYTAFGKNVFRSELVRDCIRPLAEHTAKATPHCKDERIERLLTYRPNMYMNGKDFLLKCRTIYEITNSLFIYINKDDRGMATSFYPIPYDTFEALDVGGNLYIRFTFANQSQLVASWKDLAVMRKDYFKSDIVGESNDAVLDKLELIRTTDEGLANAIKSTSNLRGIIKSTKVNLKNDDVKKMKDDFVRDYMGLENSGGVAALDASMDFSPLKMEPVFANAEQTKEFREDIYRYFGVNESIVTSDFKEEQMEAFYEAKIEPFLIALSLELTGKVFSNKQIRFGNTITYAADRMQFASLSSKLGLVSMVDRGALTPNEWRAALNLAPIEGGDVPIRRLDTETVNDAPVKEEPAENEEEKNGKNE